MEATSRRLITLTLIVCIIVTFVQDAALVPSIKVLRCVHEGVGVVMMTSGGAAVGSALPSFVLTIKIIRRLVLLCLLLSLLTIEGLLCLRHILISANFSHLS